MNGLEKNLLLLLTTKEPQPSTGEILEYRHGDAVVSVSQVSNKDLKVWPNADQLGGICGVIVSCPECVDAFAVAQCKVINARYGRLESSVFSAIAQLLAS